MATGVTAMTNGIPAGAWLAVAIFAFAGVPALAQGGSQGGGGEAGGPGQMFLFFDENGDGTVTQAEFEAAAAQRFTKADTNNDGNITKSEWDASLPGQGRRGAQQFSVLDANQNGVLEAEEFQIFAETRFETLDRNSDGKLSSEELAQISRARGGGQMGSSGQGGGQGPSR
jgi:hypothetical protein